MSSSTVDFPTRQETTRRLLRPVDGATITYLLVLSIVVLFFHRNLRGWGWYITAHLVGIGLILFLIWAGERRGSGVAYFLRHWYPALLFYPLFAEMNYLATVIFPFWANGWLISLDRALLGVDSIVWFERISTPGLTELMVLFYLFYFLLIPVAGFPLYLKESKDEFHSLFFNTALAYYVSYFAFMIFPAESPRITLAHLQIAPLEGWYLLRLANFIQGMGGIHGGAFPSSHVAAAFAILFSIHRYQRKLFYFLLIMVLGLAISTSYCRYHYAVDAIAGALVGIFCYFIGQKLYLRWERSHFFASAKKRDQEISRGTDLQIGELVRSAEIQRREHVQRIEPQTQELSQEVD